MAFEPDEKGNVRFASLIESTPSIIAEMAIGLELKVALGHEATQTDEAVYRIALTVEQALEIAATLKRAAEQIMKDRLERFGPKMH